MRNKFAAATRPSSPIAGASPTDGTGVDTQVRPEIVQRVRRAVHPVKAAYARQAAERRIEAALGFAAIYALGAEDGPDVDRLKLGVTSSALALAKELKDAQTYSSRALVVRLKLWCAGKPLALRLKADVETLLERQGRRLRGSWYRVEADELARYLTEAARAIGAELFDEAERQRRVLEAVAREMERVVR